MNKQFISEPIVPDINSMDAGKLASGAPDMPTRFHWRNELHEVSSVMRTWKETGNCTHANQQIRKGRRPEQYVRKHWFDVLTTGGVQMTVYFERTSRSRRSGEPRWWLHSILTLSSSET